MASWCTVNKAMFTNWLVFTFVRSIFNCVSVYMWVCTHECSYWQRPEVSDPLELESKDSSEAPGIDAQNRTQILCESSVSA